MPNRPITDFFTHRPLPGRAVRSAQITPYNPQFHKKDLALFHRRYPHKDKADRWFSSNGYLFLAITNFTEFRVVTMINRYVPSLGMVVDSNFEVGSASLDSDGGLTKIEVNAHFRRQKIGSELIRFIKNAVDQFTVFAGAGSNSRYRLTEEGAFLINYCLSKGILTRTQVVANEVPESPYVSPVIHR